MKIAVLSGKGGTGKTFVSVNLASAISKSLYVDCDVEAPNGGLFFSEMTPQLKEQTVNVKVPQINANKCNQCRTCIDFCHFHALAMIGNQVKVFDDLCHSCGGCALFCEAGAIEEIEVPIGKFYQSTDSDINPQLLLGEMNLGEASGVPIIAELYRQIEAIENQSHHTVVVDCPPGSACMTMESIKEADYCVIVAEPTRFGAHNLKMVYELATRFHKPVGVVINKALEGDHLDPSTIFCQENGIRILMKIPFDERLGRFLSQGEIIAQFDPTYQEIFESLYGKIEEAYDETITHA